MKQFGLYKKQKLCSPTAIEKLFGPGGSEFSRLIYPLRIVTAANPGRRSDAPVAFLISVPKKRLRHAVDRVLMRRRIREAYRLTHQDYPLPEGARLGVAFVYVANEPQPFSRVRNAMEHLLEAIASHYSPSDEKDSE